MTTKRVVIVGNGRMAQLCSEIVMRHADATLGLVVAEPRTDAAQSRLAGFCERAGVALLQPDSSINSAAVVRAIADAQPDIIFSIDNFQIFGPELLGVARAGCINFHNGPIERYRGVYSPSWAIFNGETTHGITWHYMERAVDAGAIAAAESIDLTGRETALALTLDCIRVGIETFERELGSILSGARRLAPRVGSARHYRRGDLPDGARLDLHCTAAHIDRLLRATDFRPFPNGFTYARLRTPRGDLIVNAADEIGPRTGHSAGEIVTADRSLVVACADRLLSLTAVMLQADEPVTVPDAVAALGLHAGQRLT